MPYVTIDEQLLLEEGQAPLSEGQLNYVITRMVDTWLKGHPGYAGINSAIGVLECAKLELYRRIAAPYEDKKCADNGDVYSVFKDRNL